MNNNLLFSVQTMEISPSGGKLSSLVPDEDGMVKGFPIGVIGKPSRNGAMYEKTSFVNSMTNPNTRFNMSLVGGGLDGEMGHPITAGLEKEAAVLRSTTIDPTLVSHNFHRIYAKESPCGEFYIVYGDIIPCGPMGNYLLEAFADPKRNAAFSLRSLTAKPMPGPNGILLKRIIAMITFDYVPCPGFEQASKRYMDISSEDFQGYFDDEEVETSIEDLIATADCSAIIGQESVTTQSLLDMLETDSVKVTTEYIPIDGVWEPGRKQLVHGGEAMSIFHSLNNRG